MKKSGLLLISLLFIALFAVTVVAAEDGFTDTLKEAGLTFLQFFTFNWIQGGAQMLLAFIRACVWLITFAVFYVALNQIPNIGRAAVVIALLLALIAAIFIPPQFLLLIGQIYGTFVVVGFIMAAMFGMGLIVYQIPATNWFLILMRMGIIVVMALVFKEVGKQARNLALNRATDPAIGALFRPSFVGGASGGAFGGESIAVVSALGTIADIGFWVLIAWMAIEGFRLIASFGANPQGALSNFVTRGLNNMMAGAPGGGAGGAAPPGGGGGGGNVNLQPIEQAIQNLGQRMDTEFNQMRTLNTDTNARVADVQTSVQQLLAYAQQMVTFFNGWSDYFVNTIRPELDAMIAEIQQIGTVQNQHTGLFGNLATNIGNLMTGITTMRAALEARLNTLDTKIDGIANNLGSLIGTVGTIGREIANVSGQLATVDAAIQGLPADVRNTLLPELTQISQDIAIVDTTVRSEAGSIITQVRDVLTAVGGVPNDVRAALLADLQRIEAAIGAITPGLPVDYDRIGSMIEGAQSAITNEVTDALRTVQNNIIRNAERNIYGNDESSMFKKLENQIAAVLKRIGSIKPGKSGPRQVQEIGGDCNGIGNIINSNVNVILQGLGKNPKDIPTLIEGLHSSVDAKRFAALLVELNKILAKLAKLSAEVKKKGGAVNAEKGSELKHARDAIRKLTSSRDYNIRIGVELKGLMAAVDTKDLAEARSALRKVAIWERRNQYRASASRVINELEKLGGLLGPKQNDVARAKRELAVYGAKEIAVLSGIEGDFKQRLDKVEQIQSLPADARSQKQKDANLAVSWTAMKTVLMEVSRMINGMIAAESKLVEIVESAEKKLK